MPEERRAHARQIQEERVQIDVISENDPSEKIIYDCFSRDLSAKGVRIHGSSSFKLGTQVRLVIHMSEHNKELNMEGTIKWITETTEHEVVAGIEFDEKLSSDLAEWRALLS